MANKSRRAILTALVLGHCPHAQLAEELRQRGLTIAGAIGRISMSAVWRTGDAYRFISRKGEPV